VSTNDQHPEIQLHALRTYAEARGLEVAGEYVDHGVSGAKDRRPALDRLHRPFQQWCRDGTIDSLDARLWKERRIKLIAPHRDDWRRKTQDDQSCAGTKGAGRR